MNGNANMEGRISAEQIDDVDVFARRLYRRARSAGPAFNDIASVVGNLHTVLKHLKAELEDPSSLLGSKTSSVYARQLTPLVEDSDFALQQLEAILKRHSASPTASDDGNNNNNARTMPGEMGWVLETGERERLELVRHKLETQELSIDMFLDTVQLRNPARKSSTSGIDISHDEMDSIKDKVDACARRICHYKGSESGDDDEELWQKFRDELVHEGFSEDVLRQHQDVLRAYIRQLDDQVSHDGRLPSVRGFLEQQKPSSDLHDGLQLAPYEDYPAPAELSADAMYQARKQSYDRSASTDDTQSLDRYRPPQMQERSSGLSYDYYSSENDDLESNCSVARISTRDLMAIDRRSNDLAIAQANRGVPTEENLWIGADYSAGSPPSNRYLPPSASQPALLPPPPVFDSKDASLVVSSNRSSSPVLHSNSVSAPMVIGSEQPGVSRTSRLAPDSRGREIPLDATWTRIKRSLVSLEVLNQSGLRFEARPTFVAVLGSLSREEVEDLARRSADIRNARRSSMSHHERVNGASMGLDKRSRRPEDRYHPDKYRNWDIETSKDPDDVSYVINPSGHRKGSHASVLYDTSDEDSDSQYGYTDDEDRYPPPPKHKPQPYHHNQEDLRSRGDSIVSTGSSNSEHSHDTDDKGTKAYPFNVLAPKEDGKRSSNAEVTSPSATTLPKPILKNKDEHTHVRFNPEPQVFDESMSSPSRSLPRRSEKSSSTGRDRERSHHSGRHDDRDTAERDVRDRNRDRERDRDRDRERERNRDRDYGDRYEHRDRYRSARDRDREDPYRDDYDSRSRRHRDKAENLSSSAPSSYGRSRDGREKSRKARKGALSAAGIGGAAVSLLTVLAEAATHL